MVPEEMLRKQAEENRIGGSFSPDCEVASSPNAHEIMRLRERASKLEVYDRLIAKHPDVIQLIQLHFELIMNSAKTARY